MKDNRWPPATIRMSLTVAIAVCGILSPALAEGPPAIPREFRAVWVATVENIDWPSSRNLSTEEQQKELTHLFDTAAGLNLNAIVLQVRPACDALYASKLEPWSHYLTGTMGQAPEPFYDPLQFAVAAAHQRGLELHVWFNPFRAKHASAKVAVSDNHISRSHPNLVLEYAEYLWLDPGEPAAIDHTLAVIMEVVNHYDIDGVHFDDYFYPYPINDPQGAKVPFPDDASWEKRAAEDAALSRDDWRRKNVDRLIERMYQQVKQAKPWVKVGLSPFGIWRPNHPTGIQGFDAYAELYADSLKWWHQGWVDYLTPQLYWKIESQGQSYPRLLGWWDEHNRQQRHLWPGNYTSRLGGSGTQKWETQELLDQIKVTRDHPRATGNVHFSMKAFLKNYGGINEKLKSVYEQLALVPASTWLDPNPPQPPSLQRRLDQQTVDIARSEDNATRWWAVQHHTQEGWRTKVIAAQSDVQIPCPTNDTVFVTAISRTGVASATVESPAAGKP